MGASLNVEADAGAGARRGEQPRAPARDLRPGRLVAGPACLD